MLMVSTVGTSVLGNALGASERGRLSALANHRASALPAEDRAFLEGAARHAGDRLAAADEATCRLLSAELNGILTHDAEAGAAGAAPIRQHVLVATDTAAGRLAAEVVERVLAARGRSCAVLAIRDLSTGDLDSFRAGCSDLAREMWRLAGDDPAGGAGMVFNLTGGFKGVNGFLQTVALALGAEAVYVFERSDRLMRIPRLPLALAATAEIERAFPLYRRLDAGEPVDLAEARAAGLSEALLLIVGDEVALSEYGRLFFDIAWRELAARAVLPPRSDRVTLSERFGRETDRLPGHRLRQVNEAIEALVRRLEGKPEGRLAQYEFKTIMGKPKPPATHELYLWSDNGTGRGLLRETGSGRWEVTGFVPHLRP